VFYCLLCGDDLYFILRLVISYVLLGICVIPQVFIEFKIALIKQYGILGLDLEKGNFRILNIFCEGRTFE
jgi:hypothetical protein